MVLLHFLDFPLESLSDSLGSGIDPLSQLSATEMNVELSGFDTGMTSQQSNLVDFQFAPGEVR
jgi:hypothetical protein